MEQIGEGLEWVSTGQWKNMEIYFLYQTGSLEAALTNPILAPKKRVLIMINFETEVPVNFYFP